MKFNRTTQGFVTVALVIVAYLLGLNSNRPAEAATVSITPLCAPAPAPVFVPVPAARPSVVAGNESKVDLRHPSTSVIIDKGGATQGTGNTGNTGNTGTGSADVTKTKGNNGNHYGNDKPDQNAKDVKNKHNGENTYSEHHDEAGNSVVAKTEHGKDK